VVGQHFLNLNASKLLDICHHVTNINSLFKDIFLCVEAGSQWHRRTRRGEGKQWREEEEKRGGGGGDIQQWREEEERQDGGGRGEQEEKSEREGGRARVHPTEAEKAH
jgi:hypothetical protein